MVPFRSQQGDFCEVSVMSALRNRFAAVALAALTVAGTASEAGAATIETIARQAILYDMSTDTVLFEKNADERVPPSSMSKLMTIYVVFDALKAGRMTLEDKFPVSERAWKMQGSKMFVELNNQIKVDDLIKGVVVQSGNDACVVLAEGLAGSEEAFAVKLNERAKELGLSNSTFVNSNGWPDPKHLMSARDLARLAKHLIVDYPDFYKYFSIKDFTYHGIKQGNRNPLLYRNNISVDGLKTGHTEIAGYGLTASAIRDNRRLILVVNGLPSMQARADETSRLIEWGFREFETYALLKAGEQVDTLPVWLGSEAQVTVTVPEDLKVTFARADRANMKVSLVANAPIAAPIQKGQTVGKIVISGPGFPAKEIPAVAAADVPQKNVFGRIVNKALYLAFNVL
jgi:serine-type D-Ala-D-Ala carboxypeptidase (penicillin-binding protein 5/6)